MKRQAKPVLIPRSGDLGSILSRCDLAERGLYDEAWVQELINKYPEILPVSEIEPAFEALVSVCRELPTQSGSLDNLFISRRGDIVLVECKLWRNPQARREVVAQVMDYAKDLQQLGYEDFEGAVQQALKDKKKSLYEIVGTDIAEDEFVDVIARNLRRGRMLLLIAGDGITENVEALGEYLQQHAGIHFTLAFVQLAVYEIDDYGRIIIPSIPLRTTNVTRAIVKFEEGVMQVSAPKAAAKQKGGSSLTEEEFFEALEAAKTGISQKLIGILEKAADQGITYDLKKTLTVRLSLGNDQITVLNVNKEGVIDTTYVWNFRDRVPSGHIRWYQEKLAEIIPGAEIKETPSGGYPKFGDRYVMIWDLLEYGEEWLNVLEEFRHRLTSE
jgi:hypothetical protein